MTGPAAGSGPGPGRSFIAGDPIRGLGALAVVCYHAALAGVVAAKPGDRFAGFSTLGPLGAVVSRFYLALPAFFVLSGYLISRPFVRAYLDGTAPPPLGRYLRNRALRIVPAFWLVYLVVLAVHGLGGVSGADVGAALGFAQDYHLDGVSGLLPQAWSIDVEVGFYLLLPLSVMALARLSRGLSLPGRRIVLVVSLAVVAVVSLDLRSLAPGSSSWLLSPAATAFVFVPGVALAAVDGWSRVGLAGLARGRLAVWVLVGVGALAIAGDALLSPSNALVVPGLLVGAQPLLETLGMGALVAALLVRQWQRGDCPRWLDNGPIRWVGARSYSLYLVHIFVLTELARLLPARIGPVEAFMVAVGAGVPISLVIADLGYRLVERPLSKLKLAVRATPERLPGAEPRPMPEAPALPGLALSSEG